MRKATVITAFLVSPIVTAIVFAAPEVIKQRLSIRGLLYLFSIFLPFAYAAALTLGIPAWLLFRRCRINSYFAYAVGGAVIGWIVLIGGGIAANTPALTLINLFSRQWWTDGGASCVAGGTLSAVTFRMIVGAFEDVPVSA